MRALLPAIALALAACAAVAGRELPRRGNEIVACGRFFCIGTRVVLWLDPGGYDAYRPHRHLDERSVEPEQSSGAARYGSFRRHLPDAVSKRVHRRGWSLEDLRRVVTQVVVHYDAAGTSCNCFGVLHDRRGLSCHFLLDLDGTIYQTLDLKERAWHAGAANDRSIGIEIANPGAYRDPAALAKWRGPAGALVVPAGVPRGALPPGPFHPARTGLVRGRIHGVELVQLDYTDAQYEALAKLLAALVRVFPRVAPRYPDTKTALDDPAGFCGILGHYHLSRTKSDPGPAFDWRRALARVRAAQPEISR